MSRKNGNFRMLKGTVCGQSGSRAICVEGQKKIYIHRTVCELFNGPPKEGHQCRHLDGNNTNNKASNLMWGTAIENARDKFLHGTVGAGERNSMAKLTSEQVKKIRELREANDEQIDKIDVQHKANLVADYNLRLKRLGAALNEEQPPAEGAEDGKQ